MVVFCNIENMVLTEEHCLILITAVIIPQMIGFISISIKVDVKPIPEV